MNTDDADGGNKRRLTRELLDNGRGDCRRIKANRNLNITRFGHPLRRPSRARA